MNYGKTDQEISQSKTDKIMQIINFRAGYYRCNPQRFVKDYLGITLKLFQKILLWAMFHFDNLAFIACRGIGKTYLVALFAVCYCLLYPGAKIVVCSATYKQGKEVVLKITDDFMQHSSLLCSEISKVQTGQNDCGVYFKCGSFIRVVTASDNSRGARSNILVIDESRMVSQHIVDTVLRPMNASPRQPGYLSKPEYSHLQEMNKELYLSSAYFAASELYERVKSYLANMLDPNIEGYMVVDLPYQLSIMEGLLMRAQISNEMSENTFNDITFSMEREGLFYGSAEDALFEFNILNGQRVITNGLRSLDFYRSTSTKPLQKKNGEKRIISIDVALLASKKHDNDASAIIINQAMPTNNNSYISNISYIETQEGLTTEELGLLVMRMFYQYDCDYIALDCNGKLMPHLLVTVNEKERNKARKLKCRLEPKANCNGLVRGNA